MSLSHLRRPQGWASLSVPSFLFVPSIESNKEVQPTVQLINSPRICRVSEWCRNFGDARPV